MLESADVSLVGVDAVAMLLLARRGDFDVGPADCDEKLPAYLREALLE